MNDRLILRIVDSPWGDLTRGTVLSSQDVDNNFLYLKANQIASAQTEGSEFVIYKYDGSTIRISTSGTGLNPSLQTVCDVSNITTTPIQLGNQLIIHNTTNSNSAVIDSGGLTNNRTLLLPDKSGIFVTSINGVSADTTGNVTISVGGDSLGAVTVIGSTPNASGATIVGSNLTLEPASNTYGGIVSTSAQTFSGAKTFVNNIMVSGSSGVITLGEWVTQDHHGLYDDLTGNKIATYNNSSDKFNYGHGVIVVSGGSVGINCDPQYPLDVKSITESIMFRGQAIDGTKLMIVASANDLSSGFAADQASIGSSGGVLKVKYGGGDTEWGAVMYSNSNGIVPGFNTTSISATTLQGNGSQLSHVVGAKITSGSFVNNILTLTNNTGGTTNVVIDNFSGITTSGNVTANAFIGDGSQLTDIFSRDMTVTAGTYNISTGIATFYNNSGGTFDVTGFATGYTDTYVSAVTFSNNVLSVRNSDNSVKTTLINNLSGLTVNGSVSATTLYGDGSQITNMPNTYVTGGTFNPISAQLVLNNISGSPVTITGITTGWSFSGNSGTGNQSFIGTTDNQTFRFKVNNKHAGKIGVTTNSVSLGTNALTTGETGVFNAAFGTNAMSAVTTGSYNAALGSCLGALTTGSFNIGIGQYAGFNITSGSRNTIIGYGANASGSSVNNAIALGYGAIAGDNQICISPFVKSIKATGFATGAGYVLTDLTGNGIWAMRPVSATTTNYVTGATFNNNVLTLTTNTGQTFSTNIDTFTGITVNGNAVISSASTNVLRLYDVAQSAYGRITMNNSLITARAYDNTFIYSVSPGLLNLGNSFISTSQVLSANTIHYLPNNGGVLALNNDVITVSGQSITGVSYSNNVLSISPRTGSTKTVVINSMTGLTVNGNLSATTISGGTIFGNGAGLTNLPIASVTGVTFTNNTITIRNSTGGTSSALVNNLTGLTVNGSISATTISGTTYYGNGSNLTHVVGAKITSATFSNNILTLTNNTGGTTTTLINNFSGITVSGAISGSTYYGDGSHLTGITATTSSDEIFNTQSGTSYTLTISDVNNNNNNVTIEMTSGTGNTITIPPASAVTFNIGAIINIVQAGTGQTTIAPGTGVTILSAGGATKLAAQYSYATIIKRNTNTWYLAGDITT